MINVPKGTKDVLPDQSYKWQFVEGTAREVAKVFNLKEIRTPVFEHTELFQRGVGETTDVVTKEMYTFEDKGGRSITLKPEGTAGVARSFIENGLVNSPLPLKSFYITPCYRYERPQAGRLREFHQFGIEVFGSPEPDTDAEVIFAASTFLDKLGIKDTRLEINSIGCKTCRAEYNRALKEYFRPHLNNMCATCRERFDKNPLRMIDCKEEGCKKITAGAPKILDYLCPDCAAHFEKVKGCLSALGVKYTVNPDIVRGLDYYSRTVFEFVSTSIGAQGTVCGGGRYDGLISELGGGNVPAIGFAAGLERLILLMENTAVAFPEPSAPEI
ncbi:MAG: histidine--tRNA ligase, partial [Clostridia bacterium]|nr:histidine--tRNA ligase [Clostridia bacterium]